MDGLQTFRMIAVSNRSERSPPHLPVKIKGYKSLNRARDSPNYAVLSTGTPVSSQVLLLSRTTPGCSNEKVVKRPAALCTKRQLARTSTLPPKSNAPQAHTRLARHTHTRRNQSSTATPFPQRRTHNEENPITPSCASSCPFGPGHPHPPSPPHHRHRHQRRPVAPHPCLGHRQPRRPHPSPRCWRAP